MNILPREHPVFTLVGQSKTAFAFPVTNHRQTKNHRFQVNHSKQPYLTSSYAPSSPATSALTSPFPEPPTTVPRRGRQRDAASTPPRLGQVVTPGKKIGLHRWPPPNRKKARKNLRICLRRPADFTKTPLTLRQPSSNDGHPTEKKQLKKNGLHRWPPPTERKTQKNFKICLQRPADFTTTI